MIYSSCGSEHFTVLPKLLLRKSHQSTGVCKKKMSKTFYISKLLALFPCNQIKQTSIASRQPSKLISHDFLKIGKYKHTKNSFKG